MKQYLTLSIRWGSKITLLTIVLAALFSTLSNLFFFKASIVINIAIVLFFILFGILSDTVGLSAAAAKEPPFHAMASKKVVGAKEAVKICRNAEIFSSFFNDVIGDICGIVSGTATATVVLQLTYLAQKDEHSMYYSVMTILFTSLVAGFTVGGKAICKSIAIRGSTQIILWMGKIIYYLESKFHVELFKTLQRRKKEYALK